jgi:putative ABC transport system permease protein
MRLQPLTEGVGIALESLRAHKARAALTILGVAIGVMVVMVIGAIISGFNKGVADMLEQSGPKTFWVGRFFQGGVVVSDGSDEMSPWRRNPPMSEDDAAAIERLPSVAWVAVDEGGQAEISYGSKKQSSVSIRGRSAAWPNVAGGDISPGRSFTRVENAAASQVVVINQKLDELLFDRQDPIGRRIHIQGVPYTVIGVYNPPPQLFGGQPSPEAVIPHGALVKYVSYWRGWMDFLVGPTEDATTAQAMEDVTEALRLRRGLRPGQDNNFAVVSQEKFLESLNSTTLLVRIVMFALSGVGLMVGGIGVVAIMMISVTERTREMGVRKALGATRRAILWQFLVEAATLTLVGGAFGMVGGALVALLLSLFTPIPAHVPVGSIVAALAVAALTGIVFGLFPANRASRLDPVEALRYE